MRLPGRAGTDWAAGTTRHDQRAGSIRIAVTVGDDAAAILPRAVNKDGRRRRFTANFHPHFSTTFLVFRELSKLREASWVCFHI